MLTRAGCWRMHTHTHKTIPKHVFTSECECLSIPPPPLCIRITWLLLKGPGPGRSVGGDAPNEDEYSAALERLLEGCPPSTHASSQIGGAAAGGRGVCCRAHLVNGGKLSGESKCGWLGWQSSRDGICSSVLHRQIRRKRWLNTFYLSLLSPEKCLSVILQSSELCNNCVGGEKTQDFKK